MGLGGDRYELDEVSELAVGLRPAALDDPQFDESDLDPAAAPEAMERLRRLEGDERLVEAMRQHHFTGRLYDAFKREVTAYALEVLQGLMCTGRIFAVCSDRGLSMTRPDDEELERLASDKDLRCDLAMMSVAVAWADFREGALISGGWQRQGGASLTTYFVGTSLYCFRDVRRHELNERRKQRRNEDATLPYPGRNASAHPHAVLDGDAARLRFDPGIIVPAEAAVAEALKRATDREQPIIVYTVAGYSQAEIAELTGEKSARAVEGVLARWRKKEQPRWSVNRRTEQRGGDVR